MSVWKLALAITSRVTTLRTRLVAHQKQIIRTTAMAACTAGLVGAVVPSTCVAQGQKPILESPIQDPFAFDPDFQWFEPLYDADIEDMKPKKRANRGWYGAYDRMIMYVSRPEGGTDEGRLDSGWGNRYDLGFTAENDHGYSGTIIDLNGPNAYDGFNRLRLNQRNLTESLSLPIQVSGGVPSYTIYPEENRNNPGFNTRFVEVYNSENVVNFNSYELNKTWRLEPYHYGGILEPLVGLRYMQFNDLFQTVNYRAGLVTDPDNVFIPGAGEIVTTTQSLANNTMVGGQLGFRYFKYQDRFRYSGELRVFTLGSFQTNTQSTTQDTTYYGGTTVTLGQLPANHFRNKTPNLYGRNEEFAFGFDLRSEVSYQLTRMFEIRGGVQLIDIAQGLWRGRLASNIQRNDQQALLMGATFGIALNR